MQKYHGPKHQQQSRSRPSRPNSQYGRQAYVEDAPDQDSGAVTIVDALPHAPSPPTAPAAIAGAPPPPPKQSPAPPSAAVNVFDFLVNEDTPNASRTNVAVPEEPMSGGHEVTHVIVAPPEDPPRPLQSVLERNDSRETFGESRYAEDGFHYGQGPVPVAGRPMSSFEPLQAAPYLTPASQQDVGRVRVHTKDRKRKRVQVEELQIPASEIGIMRGEGDEIMTDAPPVLHSGLTGGLKSLLAFPRPADYPPSPDYSSGGGDVGELGDPSPGSPLKRSKRHSIIRNPMTALVPARRRSSHQHTTTTHHVGEAAHQSTHRLRRQHRHRHGAEDGNSNEGRHERRHRRRDGGGDDLSDRQSPPAGAAGPARKLKVIKYRSVVGPEPERERSISNSNDSGSKERRSEGGSHLHHRHSSYHSHNHRSSHQPTTTSHHHNNNSNSSNQLVIYRRSRADLFMSFVNKGPESEKGCSMNKALKRYHRERGTGFGLNGGGGIGGVGGSHVGMNGANGHGNGDGINAGGGSGVHGGGNGNGGGGGANGGAGYGNGNGNGNGNGIGGGANGNGSGNGNGNGQLARADEEKELWKSLRLRRNDRGEIVLFAAANPGAG